MAVAHRNQMLLVAMVLASLACTTTDRQATSTAGPYVTVYHDDELALQVRRDRITPLDEMTYRVWIRWLWAEPRRWRDEDETARVVLAELDCAEIRVRELAVMHKNREAEIYDVEETDPADASWTSFERASGASATMDRLCKFVIELDSG